MDYRQVLWYDKIKSTNEKYLRKEEIYMEKDYKKELIKLVEKTEVNKGYHDYFKNKDLVNSYLLYASIFTFLDSYFEKPTVPE